MEAPLIIIICILILIVVYAFYKLYKYSQERILKDLVAWCVTTNSDEYRCNLRLRDYIHNAQNKAQLPPEYRISNDNEWLLTTEILDAFQKDLTQNFFCGRLYTIKSKYVIPGEHYFMFSLCDFLQQHQCEYEFLGHPMHIDRISYKEYGRWGGVHFDATYSLSEFAIVFHKLYYITYLFCKTSKIINPKANRYQDDKVIKEILDAQQIELSRY